MQAREHFQQAEAAVPGRAWPSLRAVLLRRLWLPGRFYDAIPWVYLGTGVAALLGALFLPGAAWLFPYLLLLGLALAHAGVAVASLRQRRRGRGRHAGSRGSAR